MDMKKENLQMDGRLKDAAASDALRRWFGHAPARGEEFCRRCDAELDANCPIVSAWSLENFMNCDKVEIQGKKSA
jgi:uncharacterized protein YeaO (DUF488 family)